MEKIFSQYTYLFTDCTRGHPACVEREISFGGKCTTEARGSAKPKARRGERESSFSLSRISEPRPSRSLLLKSLRLLELRATRLRLLAGRIHSGISPPHPARHLTFAHRRRRWQYWRIECFLSRASTRKNSGPSPGGHGSRRGDCFFWLSRIPDTRIMRRPLAITTTPENNKALLDCFVFALLPSSTWRSSFSICFFLSFFSFFRASVEITRGNAAANTRESANIFGISSIFWLMIRY